MKLLSLSLLINFVLKSGLSDMSTAIPACFQVPIAFPSFYSKPMFVFASEEHFL
jgi:hypothetical protein